MVSKNTFKINYRDGKVFYRGAELEGDSFRANGQENCYPPERLFNIHKFYEEKLKEGKYNLVRELEERRGLPETWLNVSIAGLILDNLNGFNGVGKDGGLAKRLVKEFKDRGFGKEWLKEGQDI